MIDDSRSVSFRKIQRTASQATLLSELILIAGMITGFSAAIFQIKSLLFFSILLIFSSVVTSNNSDIQRTTTLFGFVIMGFMSLYIMPRNVVIDPNNTSNNNNFTKSTN